MIRTRWVVVLAIALAISIGARGPESTPAWRDLIGSSEADRQAGRLPQAEATAREAVALARQLRAGPTSELVISLRVLSMALEDQQRWEEAVEISQEAVMIEEDLEPASSAALLASKQNL